MADIEPPSFSLGLDLDLDFDSEPQPQPPTSTINQQDDNEEEFDLRVSDSDLDDPTPTLRRLRRGGPSSSKPISTPSQCSELLPTSNGVANDDDDDDDIQDFSSEELPTTVDLPAGPAPQQHSMCSSSKLPLSGCGILASEEETKVANRKRKQDPSCSTIVDAIRGKSMFMDLTASPLRRFRLLDSDSDDDFPESVPINRDGNGPGFSNQSDQKESTQRSHRTASNPSSQKQDLWKDFYSDKSCAIPTPAFDEFLKEYHSAAKERKQASGLMHELCSSGPGKNVTRKMMQSQDLGSDHPPSHRYFFHDDLRIQSLIRSRLPYFHPLGASCEEINKSFNASPIDYMSQFGHGDGAKQQTARQANPGKSSGRTGKRTKKSNLKETTNASDGWISPKQAVSCPKDAGRRRIRADGQSSGQSSGHWFTAENGKKVYVTRTGQELTGRLAYKSYKKESGKGFRRSKKKSAPQKKKMRR